MAKPGNRKVIVFDVFVCILIAVGMTSGFGLSTAYADCQDTSDGVINNNPDDITCSRDGKPLPLETIFPIESNRTKNGVAVKS
jgi:hypothetical protein